MTHITRLQAENFRKLTVIDVRPATSAGIVPIRGRNAQGKSSTLDAIEAAFGGRAAMPKRPVHKGEDEGAIRITLDDGTLILRRFTADGKDTIEVTNADGFRAPSPQKLLTSLYSSVAFDPLEFTRLDSAKQFEALRGMVKLDVDIDELARRNSADYAERTIVNREVKDRAAQLPAYQPNGIIPTALVDEEALAAEISEAGEKNVLLERRRNAREQAGVRIDEHHATAARWMEEHARLLREATEAGLKAEDATKVAEALQKQRDDADSLPEPIDATALATALRDAREGNRLVHAKAHYVALEAALEQRRKDADELTRRIAERDAQRAAAIARAEMPVEGLAFGDGEVLFSDLPLSEASSAEKIRVSTAIGMAMAPKLRVMLVRDGSLLDDEGERVLAQMAERHGFQFWVEAVDTSGKVGIVLEDGAVVSIDGEPAPEAEAIGTPKRRAKKPVEEITEKEDATVPWEQDADRLYDEQRAEEDGEIDRQIDAGKPPPENRSGLIRAPAVGLFD